MLELRNITRRFGSTTAVDDVSLSIAPGEIVGLVGENGAGKSTLMRIAAREISEDSGSVNASSVGIVHQHFALVSEFTIAENLALVTQTRFRFASRATLEREAKRTIEVAEVDLSDVGRRAGELSVGEKAKLELIKAIAIGPEVLILDEPTSVLTPIESEALFTVIRKLAARGTAVVFISHKVSEVLAIAQRVVVMRGGRIVADSPASGMTGNDIAVAMIGRSVGSAPSSAFGTFSPAGGGEGSRWLDLRNPPPHPTAEVVLHEANLVVHSGEVVAIIGVAGNGQSELVMRLRDSVDGAFIPEDRTRDGFVAEMTIAENLALGARRWRPAAAIDRAAALIDSYGIRARGPRQLAGELSGGNQQKVLLARELDRNPTLIVAAEPTRGLDIESSRFVHGRLRSAVASGAGLLLITSDLDEAFSLADAVHVIFRGILSERLPPDVPIERVARLMAGVP